MSSQLVLVQNRMTNQYEEATLHDSVQDQHLSGVETHWVPILKQRKDEVFTRHLEANGGNYDRDGLWKELGNLNIQDCDWNWRNKHGYFSQFMGRRGYVLECNTRPQGLMYLDLSDHRGRLESQTSQHLVYIDFLATAPWNRPKVVPSPEYRFIGSVLIAVAISVSLEEEFEGRIGLHALPQAEPFYKGRCGMTDCGPDHEKEGLTYYEMTPGQAKAFLGNGQH